MTKEGKARIAAIASQYSLTTLESPVKTETKKGNLFIGIPKETSFQENRVSLTPPSVEALTSAGHKVVVESKAGEKGRFKDADYENAGAIIVHDKNQVYEAAIILKVTPPTSEEIKMMHYKQIIISPLHLPTLKKEDLKLLQEKKVTALAFEYIKDESQTFPIVYAMSEIAGTTAILIAAEYLNNMNHGKGVLMGGISGVPPATVLILGAGVAGECATRTALGLGAQVKIFDNSIHKLMRIQNNIGSRLFTSILQPHILIRELITADVVIGAIHSESGRTPVVVTEEMVGQMKPGSVIIDISIDQGGCFETSEITSHDKPIFKKHGVIHYCVPNIPSRVSRTASYAISNILTPTILKAGDVGGFERLFLTDSGLRHGVYLFNGSLTNRHMSERFQLKFTDLDLLFAAI